MINQEKKNNVLIGLDVFVSPMTERNQQLYLETYKKSSTFAMLYQHHEEYWENMSCVIGAENDVSIRFLISEKENVFWRCQR